MEENVKNKMNELVTQYKKTKEKKLLDEIFKVLEETITEKAKYIFYQQDFFGNEMKLCNTKKVIYSDIKQEVYLKILRTIKNCDRKKPFDKYLSVALWSWSPKNILREVMKEMNTQSIYSINEEGEESNLADEIPIHEEPKIEFSHQLTEFEQQVWDLRSGNLNLNQEEIAQELGVDQATISRTIAIIKKKLQK